MDYSEECHHSSAQYKHIGMTCLAGLNWNKKIGIVLLEIFFRDNLRNCEEQFFLLFPLLILRAKEHSLESGEDKKVDQNQHSLILHNQKDSIS